MLECRVSEPFPPARSTLHAAANVLVIPVEFLPFSRCNIGELFGLNGVYVLWDARAIARPTYIGEGNVLVRFGNHARRDARKFFRPLDGYIALIDDVKYRSSKTCARIIERLLLDVSTDTDRAPTVNVSSGHGSLVRTLCASGMIRVRITGYDPLVPPRAARPLRGDRIIEA